MIDTHCHIDLYNNPENLVEEINREGITVIGMTNLPSHFAMGYPRVKNYKKIRLALGLHPLFAEHHALEFPRFLELSKLTSYIGEVGLDFSNEGLPSKSIQLGSFNKILKSLRFEKKLFSIHSRKAEKEVLLSLRSFEVKAAIFHWYSGPLKLIEDITRSNYYFSINLAMIRSKSGQKIIGRIPRRYILTETDGPFVEKNGKPVRPEDIKFVISYLASVWSCEYFEADKQIKNNFSNILTLIK
ncbi:TatD family hydrolase [uncultured Croceitalea sp.]|uniref:TatD family hydrolase n=1 Tax=uncultured Croceitalea sp. TaxID=1798908 RepID=UPI00374F8A72